MAITARMDPEISPVKRYVRRKAAGSTTALYIRVFLRLAFLDLEIGFAFHATPLGK